MEDNNELTGRNNNNKTDVTWNVEVTVAVDARINNSAKQNEDHLCLHS